MSKRYATFIRRIVGFDATKSGLADPKLRDSIPGKRGIGYMSTDGTSTLKQSGHSGNSGTQLPFIPTGSLAAGLAIGNQAANFNIDPRNPLAGIREQGQGQFDIKDMLDSANAPHTGDTLSSGIGANNLGPGGTLNEITGLTDCNTGKGIKVTFQDELPPPPGWTDSDTPPSGYEWELGFNYRNTNKNTDILGLAMGATLAEALMNKPLWNAVIGASIGEFVQMFIGIDPDFPASTWVAGYADYTNSAGSPPNPLIRVYVHTKTACSVGVDSFCDLSGPDSSYHPEDAEMDLRLIDGKFVHHSLEAPNDVIPQYEADDQSTLNFCFDEGGRTGTIAPAVNGGYMIYETDEDGGAPIGVIRVFGSDNTMVAATDITGFQAYVPKAP